MTNSGGADVTITQAKVSGTGFSVTGLTLPMTLKPGQSFTFGAAFNPTSGGNATGSISVVSDASNPTLTITLAGHRNRRRPVGRKPGLVNFGSVVVGQSKSLTATLTATGSEHHGLRRQHDHFRVHHQRACAAAYPDCRTERFIHRQFQTSVQRSRLRQRNLQQQCRQRVRDSSPERHRSAAPQHSVALSWNPSSSSVVGYNVYRGTTTGGPYSKITSMNADTTFMDSSVQSGQTYFYVTTAVDGSGKESANSNQTQAVIPTP